MFFATGSLTATYDTSGLAVNPTVSHFLPGILILSLAAGALLAIAGTRFIVYLFTSKRFGEIDRLRVAYEQLQPQEKSLSDVSKVP